VVTQAEKVNASDLLGEGDLQGFQAAIQSTPGLLDDALGAGNWLLLAAEDNHADIARWLIAQGQDVNETTHLPPPRPPLFSALVLGSLEVARVLLEHGADPNYHKLVITPITQGERALEAVKLLEEFGADIHKEYMHQQLQQPMNALSAAIDYNRADVVEYLRSKGAVLPQSASE